MQPVKHYPKFSWVPVVDVHRTKVLDGLLTVKALPSLRKDGNRYRQIQVEHNLRMPLFRELKTVVEVFHPGELFYVHIHGLMDVNSNRVTLVGVQPIE